VDRNLLIVKRTIYYISVVLLVLCALFLFGIIVASFIPPSILISESQLYFGAVYEGVVTRPQDVTLEMQVPLLGIHKDRRWRAVPEKEWLYVRPSRGRGKGVFQVGVDHSRLKPGNYKGKIDIIVSKTSSSAREIEVFLRIFRKASSSPPFGFIDIPGDSQTPAGRIVRIEGWALDDIEVVKVSAKRTPFPEDVSPIDRDGLVFLGDAVFRERSRKDVRRAFPRFPLNHRAGWWILLERRDLSPQDRSPVELHVIAMDKEGNQKSLGKRTIVLSPVK